MIERCDEEAEIDGSLSLVLYVDSALKIVAEDEGPVQPDAVVMKTINETSYNRPWRR